MSIIYATGGTVQASGGIYVKREADSRLQDLCLQGKFAYVLTPRQMGKSSLMANTAAALRKQESKPVIIDLSVTGVSEKNIDLWYQSLLHTINKQLNLETNPFTWWSEHQQITATQRLSEFFETVVLVEVAEPIVIFVDEIDSTLSLAFQIDDFFAAIRAMYNARATNPAFRRLCFVLIGVATPSDLINDRRRTPFNIGEAINLTDFTYEEALPLTAGLPGDETQRRDILRWILSWTSGHPYLTQKVCAAIAAKDRSGWSEEQVAHVIEDLFFNLQHGQDDNIRFVSDRLTRRESDTGPLELYAEILIGVRPIRVDERSQVQARLKLSGIVKNSADGTRLVVRNRIYSAVFDRRWIANYITLTREAYTREQAPIHTPELYDLQARFEVFRAFLTEDSLDDYARQIAESGRALRSTQRWRIGATVLMGLASLMLAFFYYDFVDFEEADVLMWLCVVLIITLPAVALFFTAVPLLGRYQQTQQLLAITAGDLKKIQRLYPLPEMDMQTYRKSAFEVSELTLESLSLEASRWGKLIRTPQQIEAYVENARRTSEEGDDTSDEFSNDSRG